MKSTTVCVLPPSQSRHNAESEQQFILRIVAGGGKAFDFVGGSSRSRGRGDGANVPTGKRPLSPCFVTRRPVLGPWESGWVRGLAGFNSLGNASLSHVVPPAVDGAKNRARNPKASAPARLRRFAWPRGEPELRIPHGGSLRRRQLEDAARALSGNAHKARLRPPATSSAVRVGAGRRAPRARTSAKTHPTEASTPNRPSDSESAAPPTARDSEA